MADFATIEFDVNTPIADDGLVANVRHALSLGLPDIRDFEYPWAERLNMIASGPSAMYAPLDGKTVALNGGLRRFTQAGLSPTYWAGCDPQEAMVDFLGEPPKDTTYLVASKCHPAVFERLGDRNVVLWHVEDDATKTVLGDRCAIATAVSITIVCFELMARLGFRKFHTWGWDGCYMDGLDHIHPQRHSGDAINVQVGDDLAFETTTSWALEAQDAIQALRRFPFPIHVHGGGMTGEVLKAYLPTRIVTDHR